MVEGGIAPLPAVPPDWRNQTAEPDPAVVRRLRIGPPTTEFNVVLQDFSDLEIRGHGFPYVYDTRRGRLITEFLLGDRPQVATLCHVILINKDGVLSPRIKLWKHFWKGISFLQGCVGLDLPGSSLRLVVGDKAELARPLADQDRTTLLEAVRTAVGGALTEEDIRLISNRKCRRRLKTARS
ncbi:hypothetical protein [Streptomyces sp. NPDC055243]|uniref:hypothetical protein n=1 Tax=Streptomyces sp. NPDC055243 TaxID=3365720 RepID=UPI0037D42AB4